MNIDQTKKTSLLEKTESETQKKEETELDFYETRNDTFNQSVTKDSFVIRFSNGEKIKILNPVKNSYVQSFASDKATLYNGENIAATYSATNILTNSDNNEEEIKKLYQIDTLNFSDVLVEDSFWFITENDYITVIQNLGQGYYLEIKIRQEQNGLVEDLLETYAITKK